MSTGLQMNKWRGIIRKIQKQHHNRTSPKECNFFHFLEFTPPLKWPKLPRQLTKLKNSSAQNYLLLKGYHLVCSHVACYMSINMSPSVTQNDSWMTQDAQCRTHVLPVSNEDAQVLNMDTKASMPRHEIWAIRNLSTRD